jgi:glucose/arabinose dehydrogenase
MRAHFFSAGFLKKRTMKLDYIAKVLSVVFCGATAPAFSQKGHPPKESTQHVVYTHFPQAEEFSESKVQTLVKEEGFEIHAAATGLGKPRMMVVDAKGSLYVTRRDQGDVLMLTDADKDGVFDGLKTVLTGFKGVHGIALHENYLYLCSNRELKRAVINTDGSLETAETLIDDLPDGGQHGNRTIYFGPDHKLYITIGSTCNDCNETNKESATVVQASADGKTRRIFARGLRNTIGIDWHPETGELWGADNGTDWRGDDFPKDELNKIVDGGDYGWPMVYEDQLVDSTREDPPGATKQEYAKTTKPSSLTFPAHSAPINLVFLDGATRLPSDYRDDALVTLHGSWNRSQPDGYKVVRVVFENGKPVRTEDFLSGFLSKDGKSRFGRPAGLAVGSDGTIFISDDANGVIYSVQYENKEAASK